MDKVTTTRTGYLRLGGFALLLAFVLIYVGSFFLLSRAGIDRASRLGHLGYDYLPPTWSYQSSSRERMLEIAYYPLSEIDAFAISGRRPTDPSTSPYYMTTDVQYYPGSQP